MSPILFNKYHKLRLYQYPILLMFLFLMNLNKAVLIFMVKIQIFYMRVQKFNNCINLKIRFPQQINNQLKNLHKEIKIN